MLTLVVWGPHLEKLWSRRTGVVNVGEVTPKGQTLVLRGEKYLTFLTYKSLIYIQIRYICGVEISGG